MEDGPGVPDWPDVPVLRSERLSLEPLKAEDAAEMAPLLTDPGLYAFTGGRPVTVDELRHRYERQVRGRSDDGAQRWLNWIVRLDQSQAPLGVVQATVTARRDGLTAALAWVIAVPHQRRGYATEAAAAMAMWLREQGVEVLRRQHPPGARGLDARGSLARAGADRRGRRRRGADRRGRRRRGQMGDHPRIEVTGSIQSSPEQLSARP